MHILVHFDFQPDQIERFQEIASSHGDHRVLHTTDEAEAVQIAREHAESLEVLMGRFELAVCAAAPNLRWIQSFSAGMDNFLFPEIVARDVPISNVAGLYAPQGAEHAWALLLALARQIPLAVEKKKEKEWRGHEVIALTGATLGVIGMGGFGLEMIKRARGYDMTILALDPVRTDAPDGVAELRPPTRDNLLDLLHRSDAVMVACPRTPETYHLLSTDEFAAMKPTAYMINVTRGGIVDEPALAEALHAGELAGAAIDVAEVEPLPVDSPLWDAPNLIITPHRAGASQDRPQQQFNFFCDQLERYLSGEQPRNIVDKRRGF